VNHDDYLGRLSVQLALCCPAFLRIEGAAMFDVQVVRKTLAEEVDQLILELDTLGNIFNETDFFNNINNFPYAHWGYMMTIFARVDLLSRYWEGRRNQRGEQTKRMVGFLDQYVWRGKHAENCVAVQLWRHTLMHTGQGRLLTDPDTGDIYTWQLYFGSTQGIQHGRFWRHPHDQRMVLSIVISDYARDLKRGQELYLTDLTQSVSLQTTYQQEDQHIQLQRIDFKNC
jgi:hypothetical protein